MKDYRVSITAVRAAIRELQHEGVAVGRAGKGVFVCQAPQSQSLPTLSGLAKSLDELTRKVQSLAEQITAIQPLDAHTNERELLLLDPAMIPATGERTATKPASSTAQAPLAMQDIDQIETYADYLRRTDDNLGGGNTLTMVRKYLSSVTDELQQLLGRAAQGSTTVGHSEIETLRRAISDLDSLDSRLGGDRIWRMAIMQMQWVESLINNCRYSTETGFELQRLAGGLKPSIGWYSFDADLQDQAYLYFTEGLNLAYMSNDHALVTRTLANLARQAVHLNKPDKAVLYAQRASEYANNMITPRMRTLLALREAQGWAALGQDGPYSQAMHRAETQFSRGFTDRDQEWLSYLNEAEFAFLEGTCRSDLRQFNTAQQSLNTAANLHPESRRRNKGIVVTRLALNSVRNNEPEHAAGFANQAARLATDTMSTRMRHELNNLKELLTPHRGLASVAETIGTLAAV